MKHRGPDDAGLYIDANVGIAMRRLSIIDLKTGHQPISNEDKKIWVVLNGEIYNFQSIKEELETKGHVFTTESDTEVVPHLYEEYGIDFVNHLNGMFGVAIWDKYKKRLILARDRLGKKPLYYTLQDGVLIFGSELKTILAYKDFKRAIDPISLSKYLAYEYVPAPMTIFKNIQKLEAGSMLIYENGKCSIKRYWDIPLDEFEDITEASAIRSLKDLLYNSVKRRLMSDVPLGVFLSGGIDSSVVTYLMTTILPAKQVKTFSISFDEKSFDESAYARQVAEYYGCDHHEEKCSANTLMSYLSEVQNFLDEPIGDASIIPTYALSKFTRKHVTVALGGDGGDELFAGYPTFQAEKLSAIYRLIPEVIRNSLIEPVINRIPVKDDNISFDFKLKQFVKGAGVKSASRHMIWMGSFSQPELQTLLPEIRTENVFDDVEIHCNRAKEASFGNRLLYLYNKLYLNEDILVKVDRASMGCSLEVRAPFLDYHFVEFVSRLPYSYKLNRWKMKSILKKAFEKDLPQGIAKRPKKGFGIPVAKWIKGSLKDMTCDLLNRGKIKREGLLDADEVASILDAHLQGRVDNRKKLWTLIMFELWYDRWMK